MMLCSFFFFFSIFFLFLCVVRSIVYERIQNKIQKLCETIEKTYKLSKENLEVLKANEKQLTKAYCIGARPHLKNIETVVNKCVAIPNNVLLEEDRCQRIQYSDVEFAALKENLKDLQQRAKRATILNAVLKEELRIMQQFIDHEESAMKMCNIIEQGLACPGLNGNIFNLVLDYTKMARDINATSPKPLKILYNIFDNAKRKQTDLNSF